MLRKILSQGVKASEDVCRSQSRRVQKQELIHRPADNDAFTLLALSLHLQPSVSDDVHLVHSPTFTLGSHSG